jgi:hypothetical protein
VPAFGGFVGEGVGLGLLLGPIDCPETGLAVLILPKDFIVLRPEVTPGMTPMRLAAVLALSKPWRAPEAVLLAKWRSTLFWISPLLSFAARLPTASEMAGLARVVT